MITLFSCFCDRTASEHVCIPSICTRKFLHTLAIKRVNSTALHNSNLGIDVVLIDAIRDLEHSSLEVRVPCSSLVCTCRQALYVPSEALQNPCKNICFKFSHVRTRLGMINISTKINSRRNRSYFSMNSGGRVSSHL